MIYVTSLDGLQVEPLIKINNFKMEQDIKGSFKIDFNSFQSPNNPAHDILNEETLVTIDDYDFRVKQIQKTRTTKQVTALSTFYDLFDKRQNAIFGGTRSFNDFANFVFGGTGWTFTSNVTGSKLIANFGEDNIISLVNTLCNTFRCEYQILSNNRIHFAYQIGSDYDFQYRYGHNVKVLSEQVDTVNLKTQIVGHGADGLKVTYTSPNASVFGIREAEPIYDERFTIAESLIERVKSELIDYPEVAIELDTVDLMDRELGEKVWLIYEPLNIEFQTRILALTKQFIDNRLVTTSVVLGNSQIKTIYDVLSKQSVQIEENSKITRSRFEQTNDLIEMSVETLNESISSVSIKADNINLSVNNRITNEMAAINLRADGIQLEVDRNEREIARVDIKSNQIELSVSNLERNTNSAINVMQGNINLKVDKGGSISDINLSPGSATINASKINLVGAVTVLSDITGNLGTITSGNIDIRNNIKVGNRIYLTDGVDAGIYFDRYGFTGKIVSNGNNIRIHSDVLDLESMYGLRVFNGLTVDGNELAVGHTNGIGIAYSTGSKRLYVRIHGSDVGYVQLT